MATIRRILNWTNHDDRTVEQLKRAAEDIGFEPHLSDDPDELRDYIVASINEQGSTSMETNYDPEVWETEPELEAPLTDTLTDSVTCPNCNTRVLPTRFCTECGHRLPEAPLLGNRQVDELLTPPPADDVVTAALEGDDTPLDEDPVEQFMAGVSARITSLDDRTTSTFAEHVRRIDTFRDIAHSARDAVSRLTPRLTELEKLREQLRDANGNITTAVEQINKVLAYNRELQQTIDELTARVTELEKHDAADALKMAHVGADLGVLTNRLEHLEERTQHTLDEFQHEIETLQSRPPAAAFDDAIVVHPTERARPTTGLSGREVDALRRALPQEPRWQEFTLRRSKFRTADEGNTFYEQRFNGEWDRDQVPSNDLELGAIREAYAAQYAPRQEPRVRVSEPEAPLPEFLQSLRERRDTPRPAERHNPPGWEQAERYARTFVYVETPSRTYLVLANGGVWNPATDNEDRRIRNGEGVELDNTSDRLLQEVADTYGADLGTLEIQRHRYTQTGELPSITQPQREEPRSSGTVQAEPPKPKDEGLLGGIWGGITGRGKQKPQ